MQSITRRQLLSLAAGLGAVSLVACGGRVAAPGSASPSTTATQPSGPGSPAGASAPATKQSAASPTAVSGLAGSKPSQSAAAAYSFNIPYTSIGAAQAIFWVAADENIFAKHSIQANVHYMETNVASQALLSGEVDIAPSPSVIGAMLAGSDITFFAKLANSLVFSLYAAKDIQRVEDLKSKVIASTPISSAPDNTLLDMLAKHGLKPTDVQFVRAANSGITLAALQANQAVAAILSPPATLQARKVGFKELTNATKEDVPGLGTVLAIKKRQLKDNWAGLRALLQAFQDTVAFMKANPSRTKEVIAKYTKSELGPDIDEAYTAYEHDWTVTSVRAVDVAAVLRYTNDPKAAGANPANFFDNSVVESLAKA